MNPKHILFLLNGNIRYDGRVKKEISSLQKFGYKVSLVATLFEDDDSLDNYNFPIYLVNSPSGKTIFHKIKNKYAYIYKINNIISGIKPDYLHCNDKTIFYISKWIKNIKVVYDAHELLPELEKGYRKIITTYLLRKKLKNVYKVILPQIDRLNYFYFRNKDLIQKDQLYLIENFPLKCKDYSYDFFETKYGFKTDKKIVSYVGVVNEERKIFEVVKAIAQIDSLVLFIIGPSPAWYKNKISNFISTNNLEDRIFIKDPIANEEVIKVSYSSDIGICFYTDTNLNSYFCASNKLYENLNSGMTVLANNIAGIARIVRPGNNGYLIEKITVEEIYKGIIALMKLGHPMQTDYFWENQENILKDVYS